MSNELIVQVVDFLLIEKDVYLGFQKASGLYGSNACGSFKFGFEGFVDEGGELSSVLAFHIYSRNHDGDHGRIYLHYIWGAYGVIPASLYQVNALEGIDHCRIHRRSVLKLQNYQGVVGV